MPNYVAGYTGSPRRNCGWGDGSLAGQTSTNPSYIDKTAFADPPAYTIGNLARTAPYWLRGPGSYDIDMSVKRTFRIWENFKLLFDASAFNLLNNTVFGISSTSIDSANFGQVSSQVNNSRDIQLALRLNF